MMKGIKIAVILLIACFTAGAQTYSPSLTGTGLALPISLTNMPDGGRTYYRTPTSPYRFRPFVSKAEVLAYYPSILMRRGHVSIIINTGGTIGSDQFITGGVNEEYWFKDGLTDADLVLKSTYSRTEMDAKLAAARLLFKNLGAGVPVLIPSALQDSVKARTLLDSRYIKCDTVALTGEIIFTVDTARLRADMNLISVLLPYVTNNGSGFRLATPHTNMLRTLFAGFGVNIDSTSFANGLTWKVDTTKISTVSALRDSTDILKGTSDNLDNRVRILEHNAFYLDGNGGNDLNDGKSAGRPVKTVAKLLTLGIQNNDAIFVARGSRYNEYMDLRNRDSVQVADYGYGRLPIFDAADTARNDLFTKTSGQTNVYQISWTNAFGDNSDISMYSVWQDQERLVRATSLVNCNSTPGSFYAPTVTQSGGTNVIYVHSKQSDAIPSNGKLYEISRRSMGIRVGDGCKVYNMHTKRNGSNNGSFQAGHNSYIRGVYAEDGVKHNFYMSSGTAEYCVMDRFDENYGASTLGVSYTESARADTMDVFYNHCLVIARMNNTTAISGFGVGIYAHTGGATPYRRVIINDCFFTQCATGVDGEPGTLNVFNSVFYKNAYAISKVTGGQVYADNNVFSRNQRLVNVSSTGIIFTNNKVYASSSSSPILMQSGGSSFNISNNTVYASSVLVNPTLLYRTGSTGSIVATVKNNIFVGGTTANSTLMIISEAPLANHTIAADSNKVRALGYSFNVSGSAANYTLSTFQALGYELHSSNSIPTTIIKGNHYTGDYFISKADTLYGRAGSPNSFDSVYRFPYQVFDLSTDSLVKSISVPVKTDLANNRVLENSITVMDGTVVGTLKAGKLVLLAADTSVVDAPVLLLNASGVPVKGPLLSTLGGALGAIAANTVLANITGSSATPTAVTLANFKIWLALVKADVGLANVDNTSDAIKNVATATLENKRIKPRVTTTASSATPTPDADASDLFTVTALAANATFAAPTGTPNDGQPLLVRIKDNGTARTLAWNAIYRASTDFALPTTTVISKTMYVQFVYNAADSKWDATGYSNGY